MRRDRAARLCPEFFLFERLFEDCLEQIALIEPPLRSRFALIGCPDARMAQTNDADCEDGGRFVIRVELFASGSWWSMIVEDTWDAPALRSL